MKILHLVAGAEQGGAETFCTDAIKSLHEEGIEQVVICRPHKRLIKELDQRQIRHLPLSYNRLKKTHERKVINNEIKSFQPDVIHSWMSRASSFVPKGTDIPKLGWFGGYYALKNYKNCDFYMGVTRDIVNHIINETHKPHRAFLVHTFGTLENNRPLTKEDFGIPDEGKIVLLLSRMHKKKGIDTLLRAALEVKHAYFLLAGDGPDIEKYKTLCKELNLSERVKFLGWRNDRHALLRLADVCVLPSRYEPFGTVIAEAWFAEVPLVATRAAGASQYVTNEINGLLSDIDDIENLAKNLNSALNDENLRNNLIRCGKEEYHNLFNKDVVTDSLLRAYKNIISISSSPKISVNSTDYDLPIWFSATLEKALLNLEEISGNELVRDKVNKVAHAYLSNSKDIGAVIDACYIQGSGLFDFCHGLFMENINLLTENEIDNILANETYYNEQSYYGEFVKHFSG